MLLRKHHLEKLPMTESTCTPWSFIDPAFDDNDFLMPALPYFLEQDEPHDLVTFMTNTSCQLETEILKCHKAEMSTIGTCKDIKRSETGLKQIEGTHRNPLNKTTDFATYRKKCAVKHSKSLNESPEKKMFTNHVICFKFKEEKQNDIKYNDKSLTKKTSESLSQRLSKIEAGNASTFPVISHRNRCPSDRKVKQMSQSYWSHEKAKENVQNGSEMFSVKRNQLRIGKSRKLAQF